MTESTATKIIDSTAAEAENTVQNVACRTAAQQATSKASLRKLMVSCIDSALEELGPIGNDVSSSEKSPLANTTSAPPSSSSPTKEDLYGYGPSSPEPIKASPALELRGRMRRPRYQRRNSVTKFSLSNALQQVQQEDLEGKPRQVIPPHYRMPAMGGAASSTSRQLWQHLYSKLGERSSMPMKRTALALSTGTAAPLVPAAVDMPAAKRRRGSAA